MWIITFLKKNEKWQSDTTVLTKDSKTNLTKTVLWGLPRISWADIVFSDCPSIQVSSQVPFTVPEECHDLFMESRFTLWEPDLTDC